ncbi:WAT1-related protein [Striga hermonthica]|uniref:WAT1-related protein n=1 Tax=Striga hermonthica TaxID=68872 RepID=A0A9N7R8E2_STRHE|nr:WAT1-related protein [Striga hermonthica]
MGVKKWLMNARVPLGMLAVQVITAGLLILSRVIISRGTFIFALMTYRHVIAALFILPFALYFERGALKKLTFAAIFWLFMVALTGISMAMGLFYYGLKDTSATYATNFLNLIPVITFIFAIILRVERLGLHTMAGKIKTIGAMLCLAGALTITLYKGKSLIHLDSYFKHESTILIRTEKNMTRGSIALVASCLSYGIWFVLQVKLFKVFPYRYWANMLTCVIASAQTALIGLCMNRDPKAWKLGFNLELVTIVYSGVFATAASFCLISWAIIQRGPTYPSMFNPLSIILIAIAEAIFLGEQISVGSLLGMSLIIVGLYSFLWGKHRDIKAALISLKGGTFAVDGAGRDIEVGLPEVVEPQSPAQLITHVFQAPECTFSCIIRRSLFICSWIPITLQCCVFLLNPNENLKGPSSLQHWKSGFFQRALVQSS